MLSGDISPFFIPKSLLLEFSLPFYEDGQSVDEDELAFLKKVNECYLCRKKGLDLLARREHSRFELLVKLKQRKFSTFAINNTLEYLVNKNYLSETRFCESFINSRLKKGEGKFLILQRLQQKGVSLNFSKKIYEENVSREDEISSCIKAFDKIKSKTEEKEYIQLKLQKKGFSSSIIREVFEEKYK